jgi:dUTP pyrophosphatase
MDIKIKKISKNAIIPKQNTDTDAGYDLFAIQSCVLKPRERSLVKT